MNAPYEECANCIATKWCKRYKGEVPKPDSPSWCNPKFRLDKALALSEIPMEYINANAYNYQLDDDNREIYYELKPFLQNIVAEIDNGANFFFYNKDPGTGKSFHASMLLNQYIYKTCLTNRFDFENPMGLFVVYADLMDDLRYRRDSEETQQRLAKVKDVPLLLLDDIGSGTTTDFTVEQTYLILNHRFNKRLSTIITSNLDIMELKKPNVLGSRNVSRILSRCLGLNIGGRDRRLDSIRKVKK